MKILLNRKHKRLKYIKILYFYLILIRNIYSLKIHNTINYKFSFLTHSFNYRNIKNDYSFNLFYKDSDSIFKDKYLITTPLFYLNGEPHLGHAYTLVVSDVLKRYLVLKGFDTKLLVGTDEHGSKIKIISNKLGIDTKDYVVSMRKKFSDVYEAYDISPDIVVHTSENDHKSRVKNIFNDFLKSDLIYRDLHKGYFSPKEDLYYTKSKLINGKSPLGFDVIEVEEPAYFFRLTKWKDKLVSFYDENPDIISSKHSINEIKNLLQTINDMAITRSNCNWGIEINKNETIYVWFDALLGYLSYFKKEKGYINEENRKIIHIIGKDILSFHTILWPAILMSMNFQLPYKFLVHGWLLKKGEKISKSLGNSIPVLPVFHSSDVSRLALINLGDFRYDFEFDSFVFENSFNLIRNKFANTCHRITSLLVKNNINTLKPQLSEFIHLDNTTNNNTIVNSNINDDNVVEGFNDHNINNSTYNNKTNSNNITISIFKKFKDFSNEIDEYIKLFRLDKYVQILFEMAFEINKFIEEKQFWLMNTNSNEFLNISWISCSLLFYMALYLMPITPKLSINIISRLRPTLDGNPLSNLSFNLLDNINKYSYNPVNLGQLI